MFGIKSFNIKINSLVYGHKNSHLELFSDINTDIVLETDQSEYLID